MIWTLEGAMTLDRKRKQNMIKFKKYSRIVFRDPPGFEGLKILGFWEDKVFYPFL